ncbi:MAG TPA: NYN domain-containing protein [Candidatus Aminicenantes bacterium]|nr:NYN domain-containing protein [Candidatus Aminicenantes bacterium]
MGKKKLLLVDGYNVINRVPGLESSLEAGLENARLALALQVSTWNRAHPAYECVIVFDGDARYAGGPGQRLAGVRCIFSRTSHGGDDEIIRLTREHRAKGREVTVVSDDNNVGNNCRAHGATVAPSSFIMAVKPRRRTNKAAASPDGKGFSRKATDEINTELKKKFGL